MNLILMRHGLNTPDGTDLHPISLQVLPEVGERLRTLTSAATKIVSSPIPRAWLTAKKLAELLGVAAPEPADWLKLEAPREQVKEGLAQLLDQRPAQGVILVSHDWPLGTMQEALGLPGEEIPNHEFIAVEV